MNIPVDIHTHHQPSHPWEAIVNLKTSPLGGENGRNPLPKEGWYSTGIHPWEIKMENVSEAMKFLQETAAHSSTLLAIGEAGIDKLAAAPLDVQINIFEQQARLAEQLRKPLIIHLVRATDELLAARRNIQPTVPWIIHGFRGKPTQVEQLLKQGFYLSFGERYNEDSLRITPIDRMFIETDESRLSIRELYEKAAIVRRISSKELTETIHENVCRVFFHS